MTTTIDETLSDGITPADLAVQSDIKRQVLNRLKRARGQLDAVIEAVNADSDCRTVVTQIAAVGSAVERAGFVIVASGMKHCLTSEGDTPDSHSIEEMEKLFMMLR